jgi:hypothetical protein
MTSEYIRMKPTKAQRRLIRRIWSVCEHKPADEVLNVLQNVLLVGIKMTYDCTMADAATRLRDNAEHIRMLTEKETPSAACPAAE